MAQSTPSALTFRSAVREDLPVLIGMLSDDVLGATRERLTDPLPRSYNAAFDAIEADPNNQLLLACREGAVVAMLQLTYSPSLSHQGAWRATIEGVRTAAAVRGQGVGTALVRYALQLARERGCKMMQLSTHVSRTDAQRFYRQLGFEASHVGMKITLEQ